MVSAWVRSEWPRLRGKGIASILAPASQESSLVAQAGVGVVSLSGAPLALPFFATVQFRRFFECGRAVRCLLPIGGGRFMHFVVLYRFHSADRDAEQLPLTEQLFDAALGELEVVAWGQPCLIVGDFNVEPTKIPCLATGISAALWVDLEAAWGLARCVQPAITCKRSWGSTGGFEPERWIVSHFAVRAHFDCSRWTCRATQPVHRTSLGPSFCLPGVDRGRSSKSVEVLRVWEIYDDRLQFMKRSDALLLRDCLMRGDVTAAWFVWSAAAEEALADAFRLAGGSVPEKGLVLGRGCVRWRAVTLGGPRIRGARGDAVDAGDVFLYRDSSTAPLLDLRRRHKVVLDVLDALIPHGVTLAWSVELTSQWDRILRAGPVYPVTWVDFDCVLWSVLVSFVRL